MCVFRVQEKCLGGVVRVTSICRGVVQYVHAKSTIYAARGFVTPAAACWMWVGAVAEGMRKISYAGYRFPPEVIHQAIWLSLRFDLGIGPEIPVEPLSRLQHLQRPRPSHLRSDTPDGDEHVVPRRHCRREHSRLKQIGYTSLRTAFRISRPKRAKFLRSRSLFDHSA